MNSLTLGRSFCFTVADLFLSRYIRDILRYKYTIYGCEILLIIILIVGSFEMCR